MSKDQDSRVMIYKFTVGQMGVNCYVLVDTRSSEAIVIDPGDEATYIAGKIESFHAKPVVILATHGHFDHVLAALELQMIYQVPFCMNRKDQFLLDRMGETAEHFLGHKIVEMPPAITDSLDNGDSVPFGKNSLTVITSAGHTPGSVCFDLACNRTIFTGDTVFAHGAVGRTDFSYSSKADLTDSIKRIMANSPETVLCPGHGEDTSVTKERRYLPE